MAVTRADTTLTSGINITINGNLRLAQTGTVLPRFETGSTTKFNGNVEQSLTLAEGVAADQADVVWVSKRIIGAAADIINFADFTTTMDTGTDIGGGAGNDPLGVAATMVKVIGLVIKNTSTAAANTLTIGGDGTTTGDASADWTGLFNSTTDELVIQAGGIFAVFAPQLAGMAVTATSNDSMSVLGGAAATTYEIMVIGRSA